MSKYTIRVKEILENYYIMQNDNEATNNFETSELVAGEWDNPFDTNYVSPFNQKQPSVDDILDTTWDKIFDFDFPHIPDYENGQLEKQILKAYYMREIGFETIERWKLALNQMLNKIMPYYIDLYNSQKLNGDNPLENYNLYDNSNRDTNSEGTNNETNNGKSESTNKNIFEDTPSSELSPDTNYATDITQQQMNTSDTDVVEGSNTNKVNDIYARHAHGIMGYSKQDLLYRYRENLINIDELIIAELRGLFMLLY